MVYLVFGLLIAYVLAPFAFAELGVMGGVSYLAAVFGAISNATVFRIVKIGRANYLPLGLVAPIAIMMGVIGSKAIRPLIGDARNAAFAHDFIGAFVLLGVFALMTFWFRRWQSGDPSL